MNEKKIFAVLVEFGQDQSWVNGNSSQVEVRYRAGTDYQVAFDSVMQELRQNWPNLVVFRQYEWEISKKQAENMVTLLS